MALNSPAMTKLCFIPARQTGIASFCIQFIGLITSTTLILLLPFHLHNLSLSKNITHYDEILASTQALSSIMQSTNESGNLIKVFNENEIQLHLKELITLSAIVYAGICILWLFSLISLLASVKLESPDLIGINSMLLTMAMIYTIIHALFISVLFLYHKQVLWSTLALTGVLLFGLTVTSVICGFGLAFNVAWYRYVIYVNDNDECSCLSKILHFFKQHRKRRFAQEYSIPEATRHSHLPNNESVIQNFGRF